ncbi:MAG: HD domain-containing phosphohydrolase [Nitrospinota bacterium]
MDRPRRILIVDDEEETREVLASILGSFAHETETARDGLEALAKLKLDIDLVLLDALMPGMDGFEVARRIREDPDSADVPIVMVTALRNKGDRIRAVEAGANDFVCKPIDVAELEVTVKSQLKMKEAQEAMKRHKAMLEEMVEKRTAVFRRSLEDMAEAQRQAFDAHLDTIHRLAVASEFKDQDTAAHIHRMGHYCTVLARGLDLSPGDVEVIFHASPMHDVGKIGIPDSILLKPGKLCPDEWEKVKEHTTIGARILSGSSSALLQAGEAIALSHHEKWDGSGYPNGLAGEDIPIWGRICAVADTFDALTTRRPYKKAFPNQKAYRILYEGRGVHFDPEIVDVLFDRLDEVVEVQKQCRDGATQRGFFRV